MSNRYTHNTVIAKRAEGMPENQFRAIISNGTVDRYGTAFDPMGAQMDNYLRNPVVFLKHDRSTLPIGRATRLELRNGNWEADFVIDGFTDLERLVIAKLNAGTLNAVSIGAVINPERAEKQSNGDIIFREWELHEFSVVDVPGNPEALVTARDFGQMVQQHKDFHATGDALRDLLEREIKPTQRQLEEIRQSIDQLTMAVEILTNLVEGNETQGDSSEEAEDDDYADRLAGALVEWSKRNAN
jgi:HK97 family phage prohead protease